jgi:carbonic anhydrase/acetyltransferase-like protein (isoleucine patch superfamily)
MRIYSFRGVAPRIHPSAYIFDNVIIIGDVEIGENVNIWPGVVIRGDKAPIVIKAGSNIQECAVLHADPGFSLTIEEDVTVGHAAVLHGCRIGRNSVIGIGAIVLNGAQVPSDSLVTAATLVSTGPQLPARSLISGNPARVLMALSESDVVAHKETAQEYRDLSNIYRDELQQLDASESPTFDGISQIWSR